MSEVVILDVGHGNSAFIKHDSGVVVVDAPSKDHLLAALESEGIGHVRLVLVSHSDADHCSGVIGLLLSDAIVVDEVRINPDSTRKGTKTPEARFWRDLKHALGWARQHQGTRLKPELTSETTTDISRPGLALEVLVPSPILALDGVGAGDDAGGRITPNAMSVVVRVVLDEDPLVLLAADMDLAALHAIRSSGADVTTRTLVFPHHGGLPEGARSPAAMERFTTQVLDAFRPDCVLFSIGRGRTHLRETIVETIRRLRPEVHVGCTQLATQCSDELLPSLDHLSARRAVGRRKGWCCLGSAVLLPGVGISSPTREAHLTAIGELADRLCK